MISVRVTGRGEAEYEGSRLFGDPVVPEKWADREPWSEDCWFIGQIVMSDLKGMTDGMLPETGIMYLFFDEDSQQVKVLYTDEEPDTIYEDCNMGFEEVPYDLFTDYVLEFSEGEGRTRMLGRRGGDIELISFDPGSYEATLFADHSRVTVLISEADLRERRYGNARTVLE